MSLRRLWPAIRRRARDDRGQATIEFLLVLAALLGIAFGGIALAFGFLATSVVVAAARDSARLLAIECGAGSPTAGMDAQNAALTDLLDGQQRVTGAPTGAAVSSPSPGLWDFSASCTRTEATTTVTLDAPVLFPGVLASAGLAKSGAFAEQSSASFPVE